MKGRIEIRVSNNRAKFHFTLERNITIVRGDSGTGKTTLYEMIAEHMRLGEASGVQVSSPLPLRGVDGHGLAEPTSTNKGQRGVH